MAVVSAVAGVPTGQRTRRNGLGFSARSYSPERTQGLKASCRRAIGHTTHKEQAMSRGIAAFVVLGLAFSVGAAHAQETAPGPGLVEATYIPAGVTIFTS